MKERFFEIAELSVADFDAVLRISDVQFGAAYIRLEQLHNHLGKESSLTAKVNGELVGYVLSQFIQPAAIDLIFDGKELNLATYFEECQSICWIESIAVDPKYSGQGIGKKLIVELISHSEDAPQAFLSVVWEHKKGGPLATIYESLDFELIQRIPSYWQADSLEKGYSCYYCGAPPCQCSALIYALK
jgi:ribosomal protein S18 acetylase RimI-like enzyme